MSKTVTLRLDDDVYETFRQAAGAQRRSLANLIETAALIQVQEEQLVDESEMAEILANEGLLRRLKEGLRDAKARRGRFVE